MFLFWILWEVPGCTCRAFSKYWEAVSLLFYLSTSCRVKSLTIHKNAGNKEESDLVPAFFRMLVARFIITFRLFRAFSSMLPTEL